MDPFFRDFKIKIPINCNTTLLKSKFPVDENTYGHWTSDKENHIWLSEEFEDWLRGLNLHIQRCEIFHTESNRVTGWHIDMNPPRDWVKINWVFEEGTSSMEWSELDPGHPLITKVSVAGTNYVSFDPKKTETKAKKILIGPTLINAGQPHRVDNRKNTDRWCLSTIPWHSDKQCRVLWKDAVNIFQDYLI
jgi:hypothetical protein